MARTAYAWIPRSSRGMTLEDISRWCSRKIKCSCLWGKPPKDFRAAEEADMPFFRRTGYALFMVAGLPYLLPVAAAIASAATAAAASAMSPSASVALRHVPAVLPAVGGEAFLGELGSE